MATDSVAFGPTFTRHMKRSKHHIDHREMDREIDVDRFLFKPMMKSRRRDDVLQKPEGHTNVGVNKNRLLPLRPSVRPQAKNVAGFARACLFISRFGDSHG